VKKDRPQKKSGEPHRLSRQGALDAWRQIFVALAGSTSKEDQALAKQIAAFIDNMPMMARTAQRQPDPEQELHDRVREPTRERVQATTDRTRKEPEMVR
jgi:hypothetical protein